MFDPLLAPDMPSRDYKARGGLAITSEQTQFPRLFTQHVRPVKLPQVERPAVGGCSPIEMNWLGPLVGGCSPIEMNWLGLIPFSPELLIGSLIFLLSISWTEALRATLADWIGSFI